MEEDLMPFGFLSSELDSYDQDVAELSKEVTRKPVTPYKMDDDDDTHPTKYL
jgi:hypothetical protein